MQAIANIKYVRTSPKKLRELAKASHGLSPSLAIDRLLNHNSKAGRLLAKAIESAAKNAVNNAKMSVDLKIKTIEIGKGPMFKRFQPVSRGMAHSIKKRTSHIKVVVEEVMGKTAMQPVKAEELVETTVHAPEKEELQSQMAGAQEAKEVKKPAKKTTAKKPAKKQAK